MCDRFIEHLLHLFFDCPYAKECWSRVNITYDMQEVESDPDGLLGRLSTCNKVEKERITAVL